MTTVPTTAPKPRRRWLQFSLRTMMVMVLICSVPCGWIAYRLKQARDREAAVDRMWKLGGYVTQIPEAPDEEQTVSVWLEKLLGEDLREYTTWVQFGGRWEGVIGTWENVQVTDAALEHLRRLPRLQRLTLSAREVTDTQLVQLHQLRELRELHLDGTKVTDAGLVHLRALTEIQVLDLSRNDIYGPGLVHLRELGQLKSLNLECTHVNDAGLLHLHGLASLTELNLDNTDVSDVGAAQLAKALPNCEVIRPPHNTDDDGCRVGRGGPTGIVRAWPSGPTELVVFTTRT
jgi:hypothetical protein